MTAQDFAALASRGMAVEYVETADALQTPSGEGWQYWSLRRTPEETVAVWRRIVSLEQPE